MLSAKHDHDCGVYEHFGHPLREQAKFAAGRAIADVSYYGVLALTGSDRLVWLDSITSQKIRDLAPYTSAQTLVLNPQGRIRFVLDVIDDGETLWVMCESPQEVREFLVQMRFRKDVEIREVRARVFAAVCGARTSTGANGDGGEASAAEKFLRENADLCWCDPWAATCEGGYQYAAEPHPGAQTPLMRALFIRKNPPAPADIAPHNLTFAGVSAVDALEIAAYRPTWRDIDDRALPHEYDWLRCAVHLHKGCYCGQETVAKVHNLGHPPRRLTLLHLDGNAHALTAAGATVHFAGRAVGTLCRVAEHYENGMIALALLKRTTDEGATLTVALENGEEVPATQETIVPPDAGATRPAPKLPKRERKTLL